MIRLLDFILLSLTSVGLHAQSIHLLGSYEVKGPTSFIQGPLDGYGAGLRFGLAQDKYALTLRVGRLIGRYDSLESRRTVYETSASIGVYRSLVLTKNVQLDAGAEVAFCDRQFSDKYLSSVSCGEQHVYEFGPALVPRFRMADWIEVFSSFQAKYQYRKDVSRMDRITDLGATQFPIVWHLRFGLFFRLPVDDGRTPQSPLGVR